MQFVTFNIGEDLFGINVLLVREINRKLDLTVVDKVPDYVKGLMNLRGQIVTVLDLGKRLGVRLRKDDEHSNCIILKTNQELMRSGAEDVAAETSSDCIGLYVDSIGDIVTVADDEVESPSVHASGVAAQFISGVVKLDKELLVTLNPAEILRA